MNLLALTSLGTGDLVNNASVADFFNTQFESITPLGMVLTLGMGLIVGLIVALVYKKTYRGVLYSPSFAMTLIMMTLITAPVVMCIKNDLALSMGMVGALSIVRFRTAVKDPMDTAYMFWALTMGILLGAQLYLVGLVVVIAISIILLALTFLKFRNPNSYLLVLHYDEVAEHDIETELRRSVKIHRLRSKTITRSGAEMTVELRLGERHEIVGRMLDIEGVHDATLVACQAETGT